MTKHSYVVEHWKGQGREQRRCDPSEAEVVVVRIPAPYSHWPINRTFVLADERSAFEEYTKALNSAEAWAVDNFKLELRTMLGAR